MVLLAALLDREGDLLGLELLAGCERAARAPADLPQEIAQMLLDDPLADVLVCDVEIGEKIIVEKMAERPMPHVVEESGHAHVLLDERRRRALIAEHALERRVEVLAELAREMHRAERMLEAAVLGRGIDPARAL